MIHTDEQTDAKREIAAQVRAAIAQVKPLAGIELEVDEPGIYASTVGNQVWWRVPIVPHPYPERLFPLYEVLTEIEEQLRNGEQHKIAPNIILFAGDFADNAAQIPS
jgi:hypothetical protein